MKVISGCQNGVDQAALFAAAICGLETGGWIPKGCKTLDGPRYDLRDKFALDEHASSNYADRTFDNVFSSDATLRLAVNFSSPGERCTLNAIKSNSKPHLDIKLSKISDVLLYTPIPHIEIVEWLQENNVNTLNVAGNSEGTCPGIFQFTQNYLIEVFRLWVKDTTTKNLAGQL